MKTLGDYTLREIKQYCDGIGECSDCQIFQNENCALGSCPNCWHIDTLLCALITKDEILAARVLRECANVEKIIRNPDGLFAKTKDGSHIELRWETFLSIKVWDTLEVYNL